MSQNATRSRTVVGRAFLELFRIVAIAGVIAGIGSATGYINLSREPQVQAAAPDGATPVAAGGIVPLEPILVNLTGEAPQGFLRASLSIMFAKPAHAEQVQASAIDRARLRATVVEVLAGRTAASVASPEGRDDLKRVLRERVGSTLPHAVIADVLFTDFVVQY